VVGSLPLRYPPRTGRHYSDLGFMILGRIVEVVTGTSLPEALRELVCSPVGIAELRYAAPPPGLPVAASSRGDIIERTMVANGVPYPVGAQAYGRRLDVEAFDGWRTRILVGEVNDGNAFHGFGGAAGHAGLFGTVDALHRLGRHLLDGLDGANDWSAARLFATPGPDPEQALGLRIWDLHDAECTAQLIGHNGFPGIGFGVLPAHGLTVVLATNRLHVAGDPPAFEPWWSAAVQAAHRAWHER
jgi:serine-type D-Ala-D-Ala carboxypeptidase